MYLVVLAVFVFLFTPRAVFAASHISRLHIPLYKSTVIVEKKDEVIAKKILVSDYLTSTKAIISEKGMVASAPSYYPYGSSISPITLSETNKQYTGQRKVSDESPVYNYNARYYNPSNGIFIQPDSVEGPTRYTYVDGNPAILNDPSGNIVAKSFSSMGRDYPKGPNSCLKNISACIAGNVELHTGALSLIAAVSHDSSSDWLDESLNDAKKYISRETAMNTAVVNEGMGFANVFAIGSDGFRMTFLDDMVLQVNPKYDGVFRSTLKESQAKISKALGKSAVSTEEIAQQISMETDRVFGGVSGFSLEERRSIYDNAFRNGRPALLSEFFYRGNACAERACYSATLANLITPEVDSRVFHTSVTGGDLGHAFAVYDRAHVVDTTFAIHNPGSSFARSSGVYDASEFMYLLSRNNHVLKHKYIYRMGFD